jgi:hypothetical protein
MTTRAGVLCCVTIPRTIATEGDAARLTGAQVNPLIPDLDTLFTFTALRMLNRIDSFDMSTTFLVIHSAGILQIYKFATKKHKRRNEFLSKISAPFWPNISHWNSRRLDENSFEIRGSDAAYLCSRRACHQQPNCQQTLNPDGR